MHIVFLSVYIIQYEYNSCIFSEAALQEIYVISSQCQCIAMIIPHLRNLIDLVWFYGISTIVGYLMPNPFYTYIY